MKKLFFSLLLALMLSLLTGCSESYIHITEDESDAIAQYSAYLLMKYDQNKLANEKLLDTRELQMEIARRAKELEKNLTPTPTPEPTATPTPEPVTESEASDPVSSSKPEVIVNTTPIELSEIFNQDIFEVYFDKAVISRNYKSDNEYFTITAPDQHDILIVDLKIKNKSGEKAIFKSTDFNIKYSINADNTNIDPRISLLSNDIQFMIETLNPGEEKSGVLLFFINENTQSIIFRAGTNGNKVFEHIIE